MRTSSVSAKATLAAHDMLQQTLAILDESTSASSKGVSSTMAESGSKQRRVAATAAFQDTVSAAFSRLVMNDTQRLLTQQEAILRELKREQRRSQDEEEIADLQCDIDTTKFCVERLEQELSRYQDVRFECGP